jgi:DNA-binding transcriptional regulator GbsR (MarR family)
MKELTPKLSPVQQKFILHWGEMGTKWGINRTVAQIHALLYVSGKPLNAEELAETLSVARSNVSTSLKELQGWGLVRIVHVLGDRRDHFETMKDVWEMFRVVLDERKRREIDPTLELLRECMAEAGKSEDAVTRERLGRMLEFFDTMSGWYDQVRKLPTDAAIRFVKLGGRIQKFLGLAS